jgi:two-component system response regulator FixJ
MENPQIVHIVDDDTNVREAIGLLLSAEGFHTRTYASATAFLTTIQWNAKGCVIIDVDMPEINGIELLTHIVERRLTLPFIVITGKGSVSLAVLAMKKGAVDLLEKPFSAQSLVSSVAKALGPSYGHAGVAARPA